EFQNVYTEQHQLSTALTAGGSPAIGSNTFADLALGVAAGDTITIGGTLRSGAAVSGTYTVLNPAADTLSGLLSSMQAEFNQQVIASLDGSGKITLTEAQSGDSLTSITLTANNEGLGTLAFGSDTVVTEGRYALGLEAVASGNNVSVQASSFGSSSGFSIAQSVNGLGIADTSATGLDVIATINGLAATGVGQLLIGSSGTVDNLSVSYSGTAPVTSNMVVGLGLGAVLDGLIDLYSNPATGFVQGRVESSQGTYKDIATHITTLTDQMERQRVLLIRSFTQMESLMNSLNQTGSFLTQQINAQNAKK
ncbi:MAG: flagellar hook-associated protein, partial [Mariprofundus sp.]|nr:flagellar hook-associated protein [Mariprofundus sp.]